MANKKVSQLTSKPSVLVTDLFPIADPSTGQLYKTTISDLGTAIGSGVSSVNGLVGAVVLDTDDIQELVSPTNKWFTDTRARAALSASSPLAYNSGTGVFSIPAATSSQNGYLTSTDWTTFNSKQAALSGTGFVKISGTTISYDNSTYLTTSAAASTYLALAGGTLTGALLGTSAGFTGYVGIGNTSPLYQLDVTGSGRFDGDLIVRSTNPRIYLTDTDNNPDYFISNTDGTFTVYDVTNSTSRFTIGTTGNATFTNAIIGGGSITGTALYSTGIISAGTSLSVGTFVSAGGSLTGSALYVTGMTAGNGAIYHTGSRLTFANYNASGTLHFEVNGGTGALTINADTSANFVAGASFGGGISATTGTFSGNAFVGGSTLYNPTFAQRFLVLDAGTSGDNSSMLQLMGSRTVNGTYGAIEFMHQAQANRVAIRAKRSGANNSAGLDFLVTNAGTTATALDILPSGSATFSSSVKVNGTPIATSGILSVVTSTSTLGATADLGLLITNDGTTGKLSQIGFGYSESMSAAVIGGVISNGAGSTTSDLFFATRTSTTGSVAPTERMRITSSGNVGIGTTAPGYKLAISSSSNGDGVYYTDGTVGTWLGSLSSVATIGSTTNHPLAVYTNGAERMRITSGGGVAIGATAAGGTYKLRVINSAAVQTDPIFASDNNVYNSILVYAAGADGYSGAATVSIFGKNTSTNRSINAGGTINASGADYAEYMTKAIEDNIAKGDIVGVNANGLLTNIFADAISFVIKSTDPSYVGGDTWGNIDDIGKLSIEPTEEEKAIYNAKIEEARAKVDRIAFSGQVPCNVLGANVGDYIIPENDNGKIKGIAVSNPTFEQYQISVGKVWKIMDDGRAWVAVKIG